jgi:hypothetical protein
VQSLRNRYAIAALSPRSRCGIAALSPRNRCTIAAQLPRYCHASAVAAAQSLCRAVAAQLPL